MSKSVNVGDLVCVSGASGFIGTHVVETLLSHGYRVRAVVRDIKKEEGYSHLKKLPQQTGQLEFASGEFGKFDDAVKGVDAVLHLASPYLYSSPDPQKEIVDPAILGLTSMLEACAKSPSVKRVVITSSGGAVFSFPMTPNKVYGPSDWNTSSSVANGPYFYSKKMAEEAGWNFWKEHKSLFDLVVVNPVLVLGPPHSSNLNASQEMFKKIFLGESKPNPGGVALTDVRDVAKAHIIALENPNAVGKRLLCATGVTTWVNIANLMKQFYPQYPVSTGTEGEPPTWSVDTSDLKSMGMSSFISVETMVKDTFGALIQLGVVPKAY